MAQYTYTQFCNDVIALVDGKIELTEARAADMKSKAEDMLASLANRAAYNAAHPDKRKPKGASDKTKELAERIRGVLNGTPKTGAEINAALGETLNVLQIANAAGYIAGIKTCKVVREVTNSKGLKAQKEYTGYSL